MCGSHTGHSREGTELDSFSPFLFLLSGSIFKMGYA